jgi:hypothetical protein
MHSRGTEGVGVNVENFGLVRGDVPRPVEVRKGARRFIGLTVCSPNGTPGRMAVYLNCVAFGLVEDVNLFLIGDEHLLWSGGEGAWGQDACRRGY